MTKKNQNLLIISFDQWRGDWLKFDKPVVDLINLSELAKNGIKFNRCYTSSPQCMPARFSWLTGLEPSQMGVTRNENIDLPKDAPSAIRDIRERGWNTCIIGKTHWTKHNVKGDIRDKAGHIAELGFNDIIEVVGPRALQIIDCELTDHWKKEGYYNEYKKDMQKRYAKGRTAEAWKNRSSILPPHLYPDIWIANQSIKKLKTLNKSTEPWLLWISFVGPHEPFDTPWPWRGMTKEAQIYDAISERPWVNQQEKNTTMGKAVAKWKGRVNREEIRELRIDYGDQLKLLDDQVGKIIKALNKYHPKNSTNILVMADHGEMLGDGGMLYKSTFFESVINVPMIYKPAGDECRSMQINNLTSLTKTFQQIVKHLYKKESLKELKAWFLQGRKVVIEYEDERTFINGDKKVCLNASGKILWATNTGEDPEEKRNVACGRELTGKEWVKLINWARDETNMRRRKEWLWRNLTI